MNRLLCVTAHPDDEAGSFGGSLLLYHTRQVETYIICLTAGEAATHRGSSHTDEELAAARRREFARSCEILKVTRGEVLDYPDSRLDRIALLPVVGALVERIRRIRPTVILTFGAEGALTAHRDHSMASVFTTLAYHWAAHTNRYPEQFTDGLRPHRTQKLYYATANFTLRERQPVALSPQTAIINIGEYLETKITAFRAHLTQAPLFSLFERNVRKRGPVEFFHLAARIHPGPVENETDLFAGVQADASDSGSEDTKT